MKTWLSCILASLLGFAAAYLLGALPQFDAFMGYATSIIMNIGTFILMPLVAVTLFSATASLRKESGTIGQVYLVSTAWSIFSALVLSILAAFAFTRFPSDFPIVGDGLFTSDITLSENFKTSMVKTLASCNPIAHSPFANLIISPTFLLPVAFTAFIFGFAAKPDSDAFKPAYAVANSFSEIMYRLSRLMAGLSWLFVAFYSAYWFKELLASGLIEVPYFIITAAIAVAAAILVIIPLLFFLFSGFKDNPYKFMSRTLATAFLGLFSGNILLPLTGAYHLARRNLGVQKRVTSTVMPFSTFFTRGGTAMVSTICLCALCTRSNIQILGLRNVALIACVCTLYSMLCSTNLGFETIFVTVMAADMLGFDLKGNEMLMIAVLPIMNGLGTLLDTLLCTLGSYVSGKAIFATVPVPFGETT